MENKTKKTALLAALSAFQMASTTAQALEVSRYVKADNGMNVTVCDVDQLDRMKTLYNWPGSIVNLDETAGNEAILKQIDEEFAGGNYFDGYPHKLPELFKDGACVSGPKN